ncbi:MAG: acylneuraminate cytidylyltransferase family protein [Candidatus Aureabacteria bacterium]|nr:acylneuraminate cytidylyltransferase family protein [Candidatus Auribacterota bacterium]
MEHIMEGEIIAVIPARAGSRRVPGKNIRAIEGQPLIVFSIKAAKYCRDIQRIIVSTNDRDVSAIAEKENVEVMWRPDELATEHTSTLDVLKDVYFRLKKDSSPEYVILLQPTSPLRRKDLISEGLKLIRSDNKASCLLAVFETRFFTGHIRNGYWFGDYPQGTRTQDIEPSFVPCGSLYIYRPKETIEKNSALGEHALPLIENHPENVNIDYEKDFEKCRCVFERNKELYQYLLE